MLSLQARATKRSPRSTYDSAEVGAFHDSATLNLAKRRLWDALGASRGCAAPCCAISLARARAALTASIPRSNRPLARRANFGAAKSCSLVIFMIAPRRPELIRTRIRGLLMAVSARCDLKRANCAHVRLQPHDTSTRAETSET